MAQTMPKGGAPEKSEWKAGIYSIPNGQIRAVKTANVV